MSGLCVEGRMKDEKKLSETNPYMRGPRAAEYIERSCRTSTAIEGVRMKNDWLARQRIKGKDKNGLV